ncbi:MAG: 3'-5' exonuclease, partial [Oscillospiraceae bacterium]
FSGVVAAMNNAEVRTANLRLLCEYAAKYEQSGSGGLGGFVAFIDRLEQRDDDLGGAELGALEKNCVRIMSIHASKGLEFPVVLLCDTSKGFNRQDLQSNILLHPEMGFAAMVRDFSERKQHTTIPMEALKLELERGMLSEELRMLYVALTRAKEKIIITSTQKRLDSKLAAVNFPLDKSGRIPSNVVAKATSYADWILMSCLHHPDFAELTIPRALEVQGLAVTKSRLAVEVSGLKESLKRQGSSEFCFTAVPSMDITEQIIANIKYVYPYSKATQLPSKVSVSQIVKKSEEFNDSFSVKPAFVTEMGLSGAEKGIAVHQFMLFANHANAAKDLDSELFRLVEKRFLTKQQADCISTKQMQTFYNSELYSRMVNGKNLRREFRFMADASAQDLDLPEFTGETVTIQGVADAVFEEDNKLVIVDYKTDKVDNETELA